MEVIFEFIIIVASLLIGIALMFTILIYIIYPIKAFLYRPKAKKFLIVNESGNVLVETEHKKARDRLFNLIENINMSGFRKIDI